jgi:hypothetical protein
MAQGWRDFVKGFTGRLITSLTVSAAIAVGLMLLVGYSVTRGMCGNRIAQEIPSPDGRWKAVIYERDCGATTDFSTQISIVKRQDDVGDENGNVFIADSDDGSVPVSGLGVLAVDVTWTPSGTLTVHYPQKARVFRKESHAAGVSVSYFAE